MPPKPPKRSPMILEEEEEYTKDSHGCFSWFFRLFRRKKRGQRPSQEINKKSTDMHTVDEHEENEKDGFQTDENVRFHFPDADIDGEELKDAKPSLTPSPIVTAPEEDDKDTENNSKLENKEENENDGFQTDENVRFHFPVSETNEAKVGGEKDVMATAEDVGEARQAELGDAKEKQQPEVVKTWAEEVDEAEEKGLDVFAPLAGCLPHTAACALQTETSPESEATAAAATTSKVSATQRRRARRSILSEALKASAKLEDSTVQSEAASTENEAPAAAATSVKMSTTQRRRARRIALSAALKASAENKATSQEESKTETAPPVDSIKQPKVPVAAATHGGTKRTRQRNAQRKALAARMRSEARLAATPEEAPIWPSPSVRVFGSDGRPLVATWEHAAYGAFNAQRKY